MRARTRCAMLESEQVWGCHNPGVCDKVVLNLVSSPFHIRFLRRLIEVCSFSRSIEDTALSQTPRPWHPFLKMEISVSRQILLHSPPGGGALALRKPRNVIRLNGGFPETGAPPPPCRPSSKRHWPWPEPEFGGSTAVGNCNQNEFPILTNLRSLIDRQGRLCLAVLPYTQSRGWEGGVHRVTAWVGDQACGSSR